MTNPNFSAIAIVLDESGSMQPVRDATLLGLNDFIKSQKVAPGEATFTLNNFGSHLNTVYSNIAIKEVPVLTGSHYKPRGGTAYFDAVHFTIETLGKQLAAMPEDERPSKVIVAILTDGQDNESKYTSSDINNMITHQSSVYNWEFMYLGANQDAIASAAKIGIGAQASMTYSGSHKGTSEAVMLMSNLVTRSRKTNDAISFSAEDRAAYEAAIK